MYLDGVILAKLVPMVLMTLLPNMTRPKEMPSPPYREIRRGE
jgi:hypothetical protein